MAPTHTVVVESTEEAATDSNCPGSTAIAVEAAKSENVQVGVAAGLRIVPKLQLHGWTTPAGVATATTAPPSVATTIPFAGNDPAGSITTATAACPSRAVPSPVFTTSTPAEVVT